jgi:hypothetical protein
MGSTGYYIGGLCIVTEKLGSKCKGRRRPENQKYNHKNHARPRNESDPAIVCFVCKHSNSPLNAAETAFSIVLIYATKR